MEESVELPADFFKDPALRPLFRQFGGSPSWLFFWKAGKLSASDGVTDFPVNPTLAAHFTDIFRGILQKKGRGELWKALVSGKIAPYGIVTVNRTARATVLPFEEAVEFALAQNHIPHGPSTTRPDA